MHIASNDGNTAQNDGQTAQNDSRNKLNVCKKIESDNWPSLTPPKLINITFVFFEPFPKWHWTLIDYKRVKQNVMLTSTMPTLTRCSWHLVCLFLPFFEKFSRCFQLFKGQKILFSKIVNSNVPTLFSGGCLSMEKGV